MGREIKLKTGDTVLSCGERVEIGEILFQHVDLGYNRWADVEFRDSKGRYRHWQSWNDGGTLITADGREYTFEKETR